MITHSENRSVYNLSGQIVPFSIEKCVKNICDDQIVKDYIKNNEVAGEVIFECKKLTIFGTMYKKGHYIILPESTNEHYVFGLIVKLLSCEDYAYFLYKKCVPTYCPKTDLFFINEQQQKLQKIDIILSHQLPDYRPLESYKVGQQQQVSLSMRNNILQLYPE